LTTPGVSFVLPCAVIEWTFINLLTDLLLNFRSACEQKVKSEREVANNYRQMIVSYKDEIRATSLALKVEADEALLQPRVEPGAGNGNMNGNGNGNGNSSGNSNQMTLQDEVYTLEVALEDLRYVAQVAQKELTRCKDLLVEYHEALGISMEEDWNDISSDMTKPRIALFQAKVEEMEAMVTTRSSAVVQLIRDCQELIDALRISVDASTTERSSSAGGIRNMDENDDTSLSNSDLDRKIMQSLIKDKDGNIKIVSFIETDECTGISANTLDALTKRVSELHAEKRKRKAKLAEMGAIIGELWEKLHVPNEEQRAFAEGINGLGEETLAKGEKEIARLYQMKEAMMGRLIADCRKRIHDLWAETNATDSQKSSFNNSMNVQDEALFNDDLLSKHENYATLLEQRLEQMRPILDMVAKREVVVEERMQYEEFLKDPNRLQQRGAALTQQLMKEEKMSRRIKKDLPKYTEVITRKLKEWANDHNEPFLYNGEDYLEVMNRQEIQWQEYKENQAMIKRQKKQQERTVYSNTSSSSTGGYQSKGFSSKNTAAPLADKTNSGPVERGKKARPFSRLRAMSRTRERGGNVGTTTQNKDPRGNPSRGKVRGNTSRTRGILSRGRAKPLTRN